MRNCANCHKKNLWRKTPDTKLVDGQRVRIWQCRCGHYQAEEPLQAARVKPKILYFDVETALMTVSVFDLHIYNNYIPAYAIIEHSFLLCWSACWLDPCLSWQYVISDCVRQAEAVANDDSRIVRSLWALLDSADYWVAHNGDVFDVKKANYRFLMNGLPAPYMAKQLDTLKMARKFFAAESHKLDEWAKRLGHAGKADHAGDIWQKIRKTGDPASLLEMEVYCRQDVRAGINVFLDFWRWIESSGRTIVR